MALGPNPYDQGQKLYDLSHKIYEHDLKEKKIELLIVIPTELA